MSFEGGLAFPVQVDPTCDHNGRGCGCGAPGMSMRDYFAARAPECIAQDVAGLNVDQLCEILGENPKDVPTRKDDRYRYDPKAKAALAFRVLALRSYEYADAMLAEREKGR